MYNIAIVGATGVVGQKMLEVLESYNIPINQIRLFASNRSAGKQLSFKGKQVTVEELTENSLDGSIDVALFSAGGETSKKFAPIATKNDVIVIDNSSAFRMTDGVSLVVPEINPQDINPSVNKIIANPNCSTIQSVIPLAILKEHTDILRVDYTTYQAVSGAGQQGIDDYMRGLNGDSPKKIPYQIYNNIIPQIDTFVENDYTNEEMKMVNETKKILHLADLAISATCIRVPVLNCHSVDIRLELKESMDTQAVKDIFEKDERIVLCDDPEKLLYPMPILADGKDDVLVGRIRQDLFNPRILHLFVVADNLRKGAASNAVQILRYLHESKQLTAR